MINTTHNSRMKLFAVFAAFSVSTAAVAGVPEIAVDVGHDLRNSGAVSARGRNEYDFNLDFATLLAPLLRERGLAVREINFDGRIANLLSRPRAAAGSDFFLSIHHDSIGESWLLPWVWDGVEQTHTEAKRGFGLFVSSANADLAGSLRCASTMGAVLRRAGFVPTPWHGRKHVAADADNGVWYYDNLVVLKNARQPAVLFEAGVIKHKDEELELRDPERQARMADALATALAACLSVTGISAPE